jgi:prepilin-type N-terminal cleavage/methylation domain-containing protein
MRHAGIVRRRRAGFTLIELLVVIAIIGVLVALIMPAVQSARESANRTKCLNNLRQLAVAAQEYHDAFNSFPSGWYCDPNDPNCIPMGASVYMWSGLPCLMRNLEQGNLFNDINWNLPSNDYSNMTSVSRTLEIFVCPSNRKPQVVNTAIPGQTSYGVTKLGACDYRGNMAAGVNPNCTDPNPINCAYYDNGVMYQNSTVSIADITDGTTFTMLIGETISGTWPDATSCCVRTTLDRTINKPIIVNNKKYSTYWSSKHPSLVNFAKCDGSCTTVTSSINKVVFIKMMTKDFGETISSEEMR